MKKLLFIFSLMLLPVMASAFTGYADIDGIRYYIVTKGKIAEVSRKSIMRGYSGDIVIPSTIEYEGVVCDVTSIGENAFMNCDGLTSITIPNSVTTIGEFAFCGCYSIRSITIPNSVTSIGKSAFTFCKELQTVILSNGLTTIEYDLFSDCVKLTSVTIPNSVTTIKIGAFQGCKKLVSIEIPNNVTSIGYMAFGDCPDLTDVYCYAEKVPKTDKDAFEESYPEYITLHVPASAVNQYKATAPWSGFKEILPLATPKDKEPYAVFSKGYSTLTFYYDNEKDAKGGLDIGPFTEASIYDEATETFNQWDNYNAYITNVVFDKSFADCTTITSTAYWFADCNWLTTISGLNYLNTSNVEDMKYMFYNCMSLSNLDLSSFVTDRVKDMQALFYGCVDLSNLNLRTFNTANVTNMYGMFGFCTSLQELDLSNFDTENVTNMLGMFWSCNSLTDIKVSKFNTSNVTNMYGMFAFCSGLTSLDLTNFKTTNVTNMTGMFSQCLNLSTIYCGDSWSCDTSDDMFFECYNLKGAIEFDSSKTDVSYANPITGYFTDKNASSIQGVADDVNQEPSWFSLDGRKLTGEPNNKGLFIKNGQKIIVR